MYSSETHACTIIECVIINIPFPVTCGIMPPVIISGFVPMLSLIHRPNSPLWISVRLSMLPMEMFLSPCPRLEMVVIAWLEWMTVRWISASSKRATERLKGCETPPTANSLDLSVITDNEIVSTPARLVWADFSIANLSEVYLPSGVDSSSILLR